MSNVFDDNNDNEDIQFANKEWNKRNKNLEKDGFRDGIHEGREVGLQKSFDLGFKYSFEPFFTISSFEAIIDVVSYKLGSNETNEEIWSQLKKIKTNLIKLYNLVENHLLSVETNKLESNTIVFSNEIIELFDSTKQNSIQICNQFNFESILQLINEISIL